MRYLLCYYVLYLHFVLCTDMKLPFYYILPEFINFTSEFSYCSVIIHIILQAFLHDNCYMKLLHTQFFIFAYNALGQIFPWVCVNGDSREFFKKYLCFIFHRSEKELSPTLQQLLRSPLCPRQYDNIGEGVHIFLILD